MARLISPFLLGIIGRIMSVQTLDGVYILITHHFASISQRHLTLVVQTNKERPLRSADLRSLKINLFLSNV